MSLLLLPFLLLLVLTGRKAANLSKSVVTLYPPWFSVLKDDHVSLRCEGSGIPENSSILWLHNDTIIPIKIQDYNITANNITYSGKYQCQRGRSALSDPVNLEVFPDWLLLQTSKMVYMKGEPMVLRCHSWRNRYISKVIFYQNDKGRKFFTYNSTFSISQVNDDDSGDYFCSANIGNKKVESRVVRITVQGPSLPSSSSKIWFYILFYLVMGILFAVDTSLYFTLQRQINGPKKNTRRLLTRWR